MTAAAVSERKPGGSRGDVVHREQDHEPQHKQVFLQGRQLLQKVFPYPVHWLGSPAEAHSTAELETPRC